MKQYSYFLLIFLSYNVYAQELKRFIVKSESGRIRKEFTAYDDSSNIKHGLYEYYYNNKLLVKGVYNQGLQEGTWLHYNYNNELILRAYYKEGLKVGNWIYYYKKDELASTIAHKDDMRHGRCLGYSKNGTTISEIEYVDGKKEGIANIFYDNGNKKEVTNYIDGQRNGDMYIYFPNGNLHRHILYKNGNPYSNIETYNNKKEKINGGNLKDGNGLFHNYYYETLNDDSLYVFELENYNNGELNGKKEIYFSNGKVKEVSYYENGFGVGINTTYKEDGSIVLEKNFSIITEGKRQIGGKSFFSANILSEFPGGQPELQSFLINETKYPAFARENDIEGTCYVRFVIDQIGYPTSIEIARSTGFKILDEEAISVIKFMPPWQPGFDNGMPVKVQYVLPIRFRFN